MIEIKSQENSIVRNYFSKNYGLPFGVLQKFIRKGDIKINGKKAALKSEIKIGDTLKFPNIEKTEPKKTTRIPQKILDEFAQKIIFENDEIIAINKPAGIASQGGTGQRYSVDAIIKKLFGALICHRLDKDTSGVLVFAKNADVAKKWGDGFKENKIKKTYRAIIVGTPKAKSGTVNAPLKKAGKTEKMVVDKEGKEAVTHYKILKSNDFVSEVELTPKTGRTHQLRVHMAHLGHPILADGKYGGRGAFVEEYANVKKLCLHAHRLEFGGVKITAKLKASLTI